jgi:large subunit ribosomal protein L25
MNITIQAEVRKKGKKSDLNTMRKNGFIPGVIYAPGSEPISISLDGNEFLKKYRKTIGELAIFEVEIDGKKIQTVIKAKQIDPVTRNIIHVDFLELKHDKKISIDVPFKFIGSPIGVKEGGVLDILLHKIEVKCFPKDIIEDIQLDLSELKIGDTINVSSLDLQNVEIDLPGEISIVSVHAPKSEVEEVSEEEGEEGVEGEGEDSAAETE